MGRAAIDGTEGLQAGVKQGSEVAVANPGKTGQPGQVSLTAAALQHFKASFFQTVLIPVGSHHNAGISVL